MKYSRHFTFGSIFLTLGVVALVGCRNYSFSGADIPADAKTYSVETFQTRAPLAGPLSGQIFSETLRDLVQAQTPLNMIRESGDIQYEGSITGYNVQPVAIQSNETAALNRLTMTVSVRYSNKLEPGKDFEQSFTRFADFDSATDLTSVEETLVTEVSGQLAQDIFDRSLGNW